MHRYVWFFILKIGVLILLAFALVLSAVTSPAENARTAPSTDITPMPSQTPENQKQAISSAAAEAISPSPAPAPSPALSPAPSPSTCPTPGENAIIIFTFDDGYVSDYELAYPILKKYGIRGTSYIIPKYLDNGTPYALTWDKVKEMKEYGWIFGCHTYKHSDLKKLSNKEIAKSMEQVNEAFIKQGLEPPKLHAFPFGHYNDRVIEAIKPYRTQMRTAFYSIKFVDFNKGPYEIDCIKADMTTRKQLRKMEQAVDKAFEEKAVVVFRCHCLYKENVDDMGDWPVQTDSRLFDEFVQYCVDKGCTFATMNDLAEMFAAREIHPVQ